MHVYFYNSSDPGDPNLYNWAAGPSGHFELLVPRAGQEGGSVDAFGQDNDKRGAAKRSPADRLPAGGGLSAEADITALETEGAARAEVCMFTARQWRGMSASQYLNHSSSARQ